MKKQLLNLACFATALWLTGCGGQIDKSAFNNAAPEIKQVWEQALAADHANNYVAASTNYLALLSREISPEQFVVVQSASRAIGERMQAAAAKGDAAAQKAIEDLKALRGTPTRPGRPATP